MNQKHARALKRGYRRQQKAAAREEMLLDEAELDELLGYLRAENALTGCDGSLRLTVGWGAERGITATQLAGSLAQFGAVCDCEVVRNVELEEIF
jgi:hypothetical protein